MKEAACGERSQARSGRGQLSFVPCAVQLEIFPKIMLFQITGMMRKFDATSCAGGVGCRHDFYQSAIGPTVRVEQPSAGPRLGSLVGYSLSAYPWGLPFVLLRALLGIESSRGTKRRGTLSFSHYSRKSSGLFVSWTERQSILAAVSSRPTSTLRSTPHGIAPQDKCK